MHYKKTKKDADRDEVVSVYNPSILMHLTPEKLEKAIAKIAAGAVDFVGAR
jgi:hypothetical protein